MTNGCKYFANGTPVAGQQFDYAFDTIGNRTQTLSGGDQTGANLRVANYSANNLNQITSRDVPPYVDIMGASILTNAVTVNGQTAYRNQEYYRQQLAVNNTNSALWTNITVSGGQTVSGNIYVAQEPEIFNYDPDGNLTNDGRWAYTWDAENRLIGMTANTTVGPQYQLAFAYDAKGRRIQKIDSLWNASTLNYQPSSTNCFLYDGWNLLAILNPQSSILDSFVWGSDLSGSMQGAGGVGGLLEVSYYGASTTNCFPAFDGNGNLAALVNAADGTLLANYEYGPFGEVIRATGPMAKVNPIRFSTKYQDDESDLLYYGHRYYKASTGTWPNRDPIEEDGGNNIYEFVGNSPVNFVDFRGWKKCGVETFTVKWIKMGYVDQVFLIDVNITFKNGGDYDSRCCEYKQLVKSKAKVTHADGSPPTVWDDPWSDDNYSRGDDSSGGGLTGTTFHTTDNPGIGNVASDSTINYWSFSAEQIVYSPGKSWPADPKKKLVPCDCEKNKEVAKKGPHTGTMSGPASGPLKITGAPANL